MIVVSTGMEGDTQKDLVLTEARAMVIREYLVENFGFDDGQLKTLGLGKQTGENLVRMGAQSRSSSSRRERRFRQTRQVPLLLHRQRAPANRPKLPSRQLPSHSG